MQDNNILVPCIGYQNINARYRPLSDHTFESTIAGNNGLCDNCLQRLREIWIESLLEPEHKAMSFDTFKIEQCNTAYVKAQEYAKSSDGSIVLWGKKYGTGKTHLAISIARYMIDNYPMDSFNYPVRCPANFTTESDLLDRIRASFSNNGETEHTIISQFTKPRILVLDDVGKVTPQNTDFLHRIMFILIDRIYRQHNRLILTTNLGMAELSIHMGEACVSRLHEMGKIIEVKGMDYRLNYPEFGIV